MIMRAQKTLMMMRTTIALMAMAALCACAGGGDRTQPARAVDYTLYDGRTKPLPVRADGLGIYHHSARDGKWTQRI